MDDYYGQIDAHCGTGNALSIAANRLSYIFDWHGPSLIVDTACSSSLVALHTAAKHLQSADADLAICGGVNLILTPETTIAFSNARMLSPDGFCRPFDSRANGYVRGEGAGVVVMKRLTDAVAAGDRVLAVVRGSAVNQDGRTSGIAAPSSRSQEAVIRRALSEAGLTPEEISYVEAHGTGTPLGDPIELEALTKVFGPKTASAPPCLLSSVKANIGHLETAAGIASLIKVVLMMRHGQYVPQAEFRELNPHASLVDKRLKISESLQPWNVGAMPRRAGVSSFGFGGTNAHVVLEEASEWVGTSGADANEKHFRSDSHLSFERPHAPVGEKTEEPLLSDRLLAVSAKSASALKTITRQYADYIAAEPAVEIDSICYAANCGRSHFPYRVAITAATTADLHAKLDSLAKSDQPIGFHNGFELPKVAFLFTGQGGQYAGMGEQLFRQHPIFAQVMTRCDEIASDLLGVSLLGVMHDQTKPDLVNQTRYTQPALFALEYSLALLWRSWGIEPVAMLGHSVGEYVAATLAGVMTLEDGLRLICKRAELMHGCPGDGAMAAIAAPADLVRQRLVGSEKQVAIAACNGPVNTVISGASAEVQRLMAAFSADGLKVKPLVVTHAFHSPLMDPMLDEFERFASTIAMHKPMLPIVSNLTGEVMTAAPAAAYWRHHLRNPVLFEKGIQSLVALGPDHIIESGPAPVLLAMGRQVVDQKSLHWLPSMRAGQADWRVMLTSLSQLYQSGAKIRWENLQPKPEPLQSPLPNYPFERKRHWYVATGKPGTGLARIGTQSAHPLLGVEIATATGGRIFDSQLHPDRPDYLVEHKVQGSVVTPAAAYVELALAAGDVLFGSGNHVVTDLSIQQAMFLAPEIARHVQLVVSDDGQDRRQFKVLSRSADAVADAAWSLHACGTIVRESAAPPLASDSLAASNGHAPWRHSDRKPDAGMSADSFYDSMRKRGFDYGSRFQVLSDLRSGDNEAWATIEINESVRRESQRHRIHPALLDGCLQAMAAVVPGSGESGGSNRSYLPTAIGTFQLLGDPTEATQLYVRRRITPGDEANVETVIGDVVLLDADAEVVAELLGVKVQSLGATAAAATQVTEWLYKLNWQRDENPQADPASPEQTSRRPLDAIGTVWMVVNDAKPADEPSGQSVAAELLAQLRSLHGRCVEVRLGGRFSAVDGDTFEVDAESPEDFAKLFSSAFPGNSPRCDAIVDLSSINEGKVGTASPRSQSPSSGAAPANWAAPVNLIRQLARSRFAQSPKFWIATSGAQPISDGEDCEPAAALLWGLGRTANLEYAGGVALLDLDPAAEAATSADQLLGELFATDGETQVAFREGVRYVARLHQATDDETDSPEASGRKLMTVPAAPFKLRMRGTGSFDQLYLDSFRLPVPTGDQVQLRIHATGLNFSDVLKAMGLYPGLTDQEPPLGIECAGIVTAVGPDAKRFKVGDEVMGVVPYSFASHGTTAEFALVHKPQSLSYSEAATVPITYLTAHYALCWLARIQPGERVLIHAAAGGVGLAAIQIANHIGAKVFATAGSDIKRQHVRSLGVQHIYNSRGTEFANQILKDTDGQGVDIVLNSLPGDAIPKSLSILSAYGRFLEIGKTDIYQDRMIGLSPFQDNLSYFAIDLDRMLRQRPAEIERLFAEVMTLFNDGSYKPLPAANFPASQTATAFRYMAQRKNIGKVIVTFDEVAEDSAAVASDDSGSGVAIKPGASYLVTGGLGALGIRIAQWLADSGADHILLLARSVPSPEQLNVVNRLSTKAKVVCLQGDVSDQKSLASAISQIPADFPSIAGVIHAAGALADGLLYDMTADRFAKPLAAKVDGGWNLHQASLDWPLDFFVLFSSVASVLGSPGQANYSAANAYLDALAAHRRASGLPATTINWGPWAEGGMATDAHRDGQIGDRGLRLQSPQQSLDAMQRILETDPSHDYVVMDVNWSALAAQFNRGRPKFFDAFAGQWQSKESSKGSVVDHATIQKLRIANTSDRLQLIKDYLAKELGRILGVAPEELRPAQPLSVVGVDSLMAMELKSNLESKLQIEVPMSSLMDGPSIDSLAGHLMPMFETTTGDPPSADSADGKQPTGRGASLLPLQTHSLQPAVFCIHPVGGDLRCYQQMAKHIGQHRHVMAIRPQGVDRGSKPHDDIQELASDYVSLIRNYQKSGPYLLMGWSTGGIFAYEMARQLIDAGQTVDLTFIDTPTSSILEHVDLNDDARFLYDLVNFSNWFSGASIRIEYAELKEMRPAEALDRILYETKQHGILPSSATREDLERRIDMCRHHLRAAMNYQPKPIDQTVSMYRPQQSAVLSLASGRQLTDDLGWAPILGDRLQIHRVSGDHFSMLTGSNAGQLASAIVEQLSSHTNPTKSN
jgi:myxalamid-type polyketide synthase MxaB